MSRDSEVLSHGQAVSSTTSVPDAFSDLLMALSVPPSNSQGTFEANLQKLKKYVVSIQRPKRKWTEETTEVLRATLKEDAPDTWANVATAMKLRNVETTAKECWSKARYSMQIPAEDDTRVITRSRNDFTAAGRKRWSAEDDRALLAAYRSTPGRWVQIATVVQAPPEHCRGRFRYLKKHGLLGAEVELHQEADS